jgi:hypothetical protein
VVLRVVRNEGERDGLSVAVAHIESAIAHLNNAAQGAVQPSAFDFDLPCDVEELRLIVRALADIRESLRTVRREGTAKA